MPPPEEALVHAPTWAAVTPSGEWQPMTLVMALEETTPDRAGPRKHRARNRALF